MKKYLFILISTFAFGQAPFSKEFPNTLAVKGLVYFNLFRPNYGYNIGIEKGFLKNNSIGIKYFYDAYIPRKELITDKFGVKHDLGDYENDIDKSWAIEYKYYLPFESFRQRTGVSFYTSLSYLKCVNIIERDINYNHDYYNQSTKSSFFGPAIGVNVLLGAYSSWSIDTQIGFLYGQKNVITNYEIPYKFVLDETYKTDIFRFEIMVAYNIDWE
jgi:hypothetical protein